MAYNKPDTDGKTPFEGALLHAFKFGSIPVYAPSEPHWHPKTSLAVHDGVKKGFLRKNKKGTKASLTRKGMLEAVKIAFLHNL